MAHVVVLATGGTIASAAGPQGGRVAQRTATELIEVTGGGGIEVEGKDIMNVGSYLMGHHEMRIIAEAVATELARDDVCGVVVTHGTDTMEETGFLLDVVHDSDKPVVLTGAQKAADQPDTDGPQNLRHATIVAGSRQAVGYGALLVFAGRIFGTQRTRKFHTIAAEPFVALEGGQLGRVDMDGVVFMTAPVRREPLPPPDERFDTTRVDVVAAYPNADAALATAAVEAGAQGVILAAMGSGNGNHALVDWTRKAVDGGVVVGLSTRVPEGPVVPLYANGGAVDLIAAGALNLKSLPPYHGRLLLALLLSRNRTIDEQMLASYV